MPNEIDIQSRTQANVKQRIMHAAGRLFAEKGFAATSISDIAEASDVGRALIYYYFKDKRDLHDSILREGSDSIIRAAESSYAYEGRALDRLRQFAVRFRQLHLDYPDLGRMAMRAEMEGVLTPDAHPKEHMDRVFSILRRIVEEGIASGEFRNVDPTKTVHMVMGLIHSLAMMHIQGVADLSSERDIDFAMSVLARGIATPV